MTSISEVDAMPKPNKPSDSAFKQQRLPAWQPIYTAGTILPIFFVIGILFIPIGVGLLYVSNEVKEHIIDYTDCYSTLTTSSGQIRKCKDVIAEDPKKDCYCKINFILPVNFQGKVYMYYRLTNFYQNHRRYVKSRDDDQLLGDVNKIPSEDCIPFHEDEITKKSIAPCGAIANSLFSDELTLTFNVEYKKKEVPLLKTGIAWESDKKIKFKNPSGDGSLKEKFKNCAKPKNWTKNIWELDLENENNNGLQNEDLIVWMRTAALPTFRKLYRRVNHDQEDFANGLYAGNYTLTVKYLFSVSTFDGTKSMILSTTSLLGGKNPFLGIAFIAVGSVYLLLGVALLLIHFKFSKKQ